MEFDRKAAAVPINTKRVTGISPLRFLSLKRKETCSDVFLSSQLNWDFRACYNSHNGSYTGYYVMPNCLFSKVEKMKHCEQGAITTQKKRRINADSYVTKKCGFE